MKIIFLNTWGGKVYDPFIRFLQESAGTTDFFCFQEIFDSALARKVSWGGRANILADIEKDLPEFRSYYAPVQWRHDGDDWLDFEVSQGLAIFVRRDLAIDSAGEAVIHGEKNGMRRDSDAPYPCNVQYVRFRRGIVGYTITNLHGTAWPGSKLDSAERLAQSQKIAEFLKGERGEKILGGDFNLMPDTESIRMIESAGMRNLIKEFNIPTTRNDLAWGRYPDKEPQYFSDYVFVSPGVRVIKFSVPPLAVSDHLPLMLECQ